MDRDNDTAERNDEGSSTTHFARFWCLFAALCLISFIFSIDATIITTALSTITREIGGEEQYVWIANSFVFASTAPQPLFAQVSNIFGRRNPMLLPSRCSPWAAIAAGAKDTAMLIGGRTVQGLGTGGIYVLLDVVCCDLVSLRERSRYLGIMLSTAAVGTTVGPIIGGVIRGGIADCLAGGHRILLCRVFCVCIEKHVELRKELNTEFELEEGKTDTTLKVEAEYEHPRAATATGEKNGVYDGEATPDSKDHDDAITTATVTGTLAPCAG